MAGRITWLGHSTVVIDLDETRLLTDPVLRRRVLHLRRDAAVHPPHEIDAILISHLHYDHLDLWSLAAIGVEKPIVIPRGGRPILRGFENVSEVEPGSELRLGNLAVDVVEADHDGRRRRLGAPVPAVGFVVRGSRSVYFAGDTDLFEGMRTFGRLDVALLPVWGWGPTVGPGHLTPERAAQALTLLRPVCAVPIHWGTYRVAGTRGAGQAPADAFALAAAEVAPRVDVRVLPLRGSLDLS
jgi:L-ascorbate metabolism protein UlaG (beta-lactamase superfamily)